MKDFIKGKTKPGLAFWGYGVVGSAFLLFFYFIASSKVLLIVGPEYSLHVFLSLFILEAIVWIFLFIGIWRSLSNIDNKVLMYVSKALLSIWSLYFLVGMPLAIILPVLKY